jgi:hypothetical protein
MGFLGGHEEEKGNGGCCDGAGRQGGDGNLTCEDVVLWSSLIPYIGIKYKTTHA